MSSCVNISGCVVTPAQVQGSADVFQSPQFVLVKPPWSPDENYKHCELCSSKFNQLKRRHHCRVCGAVRCAKCCKEKIPLPQLGIEEGERVCESCRPATEYITKARSTIQSFLVESSKGLATLAGQDKHVAKIVELGGVQTLVMLASQENETVLTNVTSGLQCLSKHQSLLPCLTEAGAVKAICRILSNIGDHIEQVAIDGLTCLMTFCQSAGLKAKVIQDGGLNPVMHFAWSQKEAISLVAMTTLGLIAELPSNHAAIFDSKDNAVARLLQSCVSENEQMQEVSLKTLAYLSTGHHDLKHRLVQEDFSSGRCIQRVFTSPSTSPTSLCHAACLVANLAVSPQDQTGLSDLLHLCCDKVPVSDSNTELLTHLTRALANFAQHKQNTSRLVSTLPCIVKHCLRSGVSAVQSQSMKCILSLLVMCAGPVTDVLMSDGANIFLTNLAEIPSLLTNVHTQLSFDAPDILNPR